MLFLASFIKGSSTTRFVVSIVVVVPCTVRLPPTVRSSETCIFVKELVPELFISPYTVLSLGILRSALTFNSSDPLVILPYINEFGPLVFVFESM